MHAAASLEVQRGHVLKRAREHAARQRHAREVADTARDAWQPTHRAADEALECFAAVPLRQGVLERRSRAPPDDLRLHGERRVPREFRLEEDLVHVEIAASHLVGGQPGDAVVAPCHFHDDVAARRAGAPQGSEEREDATDFGGALVLRERLGRWIGSDVLSDSA